MLGEVGGRGIACSIKWRFYAGVVADCWRRCDSAAKLYVLDTDEEYSGFPKWRNALALDQVDTLPSETHERPGAILFVLFVQPSGRIRYFPFLSVLFICVGLGRATQVWECYYYLPFVSRRI